ncbi:MAG: spore gernimation protein [Coriobacteriia bacterium]|nr:spore gernimation protein [Coriobacteriia bacterium]
MATRTFRLALVLVLIGMLGLLPGCSRKSDQTTPPAVNQNPGSTVPTSSSEPAAPQVSVVVYLIDAAEKVTPVRRTVTGPAVANGAITALLAGPTTAEKAAGLRTLVPEGTTLGSVTIQDGVATVDLSSAYQSGGGSLSMQARVAQIVFTLTQFSTVNSAKFKLDGKPLTVLGGEGIELAKAQTRKDWESFAPAVLIETPLRDDLVTTPLRVQGSANVFEAVFELKVVGSGGQILATKHVMATSGTGTRGTFDATLTWDSAQHGNATVVAWYSSAKDGSPVVVAEIPIRY